MQRPEDFIGFIVFGIVFVALSVNVSASSSYQRDEYISSWVDEDSDCQNLRHEMLIRYSQLEVTFTNSDRCTVDTGRWFGPYLGKVITMASDRNV